MAQMLRELLDSNNLETKGITLNELAKITHISIT
jgi:hypothetical protein